MKVKYEGFESLLKRLEEVGRIKEAEEASLTKAGEYLRDKIKENVPVQKIVSGGKLRDSIVVSEVKDGKVEIGSSVSSRVSHRAHFIEFGTSEITATPFLRSTFEVEKGKVEKIIAEEVSKVLKL